MATHTQRCFVHEQIYNSEQIFLNEAIVLSVLILYHKFFAFVNNHDAWTEKDSIPIGCQSLCHSFMLKASAARSSLLVFEDVVWHFDEKVGFNKPVTQYRGLRESCLERYSHSDQLVVAILLDTTPANC